jgi:hypothetical protein
MLAAGFHFWNGLVRFFEEYSGLTIRSPRDSREVWIDFSTAIRVSDPDWIKAYEDRASRKLAPIGGYSHMTLCIAEDGAIYGGYDNEFGRIGSDICEAVDSLLNRPPVPLDMPVEG